MAGVTWRELSADAPEPGEHLAAVRDPDGNTWVRGVSYDNRVLWVGTGGSPHDGNFRDSCSWVNLKRPLRIAESIVEVTPYGEWPSAFDVRAEALRAAARATDSRHAEDPAMHLENVLFAADRFEAYLRSGEDGA